jgi:hypothetical protein
MKVQAIVSECLRGVLDRKYTKRLEAYEQAVIPQLAESIEVRVDPEDAKQFNLVEDAKLYLTSRELPKEVPHSAANFVEPQLPVDEPTPPEDPEGSSVVSRHRHVRKESSERKKRVEKKSAQSSFDRDLE